MNPYSMGGWGQGLQGAGDALMRLAQLYEGRRQDTLTRNEQAARLKAAEEERKRQQAEADRLYNQNLEFKKFELGLEEAEPLERRLRGPGMVDVANAAPQPEGWMGKPLTFDRSPLEAMAADAAKRMQGSRAMTLTDASGKATRYVQPSERTPEGRERATREAYFKQLEASGYTPEQLNQLRAVVDAPQGLASAVLGIVRPEKPEAMTPYQQAQVDLEREKLKQQNARQGTAATKPPARPTEAQEKSFLYYDTMSRALGEMQGVESEGKVRGWAIQTALRAPFGAGNLALNPAEQAYLRAARDFAAGVLRKESGAAIKDDEIRDTFARYIEAPGDSQRVRESKRKAREAYMNSMKELATPATRYYEWTRSTGGTGSGPSIDELIDFYMAGGR